MNDYELKVKVYNARIRKRLDDLGYGDRGGIARFFRDTGVDAASFYKILAMTAPVYTKAGELTTAAERICYALQATPDDLWSAEQSTMVLETNTSTRLISSEQMHEMLGQLGIGGPSHSLVYDDPAEAIEREDAAKDLLKEVDSLSWRNKKILQLRFGLNGEKEHTLEEVAQKFDVTRDRIRQIEVKALSLLKKSAEERQQHKEDT